MTTYMIEASWGERLEHDVKRFVKSRRGTGVDLVALTSACNEWERGVHNSYTNLFRYDTAPTREGARRRAHVLALAIGNDPADHDIEIERPRWWPTDAKIRKGIIDLLKRHPGWSGVWADEEGWTAPSVRNAAQCRL